MKKSFFMWALIMMSIFFCHAALAQNVRQCKYDAGRIRQAVIYKNAGIDMKTQLEQTDNPVLRTYLPVIYKTENANPTTFFRDYFFKCRGY
jgi:hypothetical protein